MAKDRAASRRSQLARFSRSAQDPRGGASALTSRIVSLAATTVLRASHLASDHHRNALMLAVFGFKVAGGGLRLEAWKWIGKAMSDA